VTFPHVVASAYLTAGAFVVGVAFWLMMRGRTPDADRGLYRRAVRVGAVVALVSGLAVAVSGDVQGKIMTEVQPMKMAAAEGLYETEESCAPFSILTVGSLDGSEERFSITVPCLLSYLGTGSVDGRVEGINDLREQYREEYGQDPGATYYTAGDYVPNIPVTYWTFRLMIGLGALAALGAAVVLYVTRGGRVPTHRAWTWVAVSLPLLPVAANSFGWLFTELGRQPWAVFGLMTVERAVSPGVSVGEAATSLLALTVIYAVLAVVEVGLLLHYIRKGADPFEEPPDPTLRGLRHQDQDEPLTFAY
jgi:cytochrome bd ubiquinol oxidase subunit I